MLEERKSMIITLCEKFFFY